MDGGAFWVIVGVAGAAIFAMFLGVAALVASGNDGYPGDRDDGWGY